MCGCVCDVIARLRFVREIVCTQSDINPPPPGERESGSYS